jgi:hypothetical protein
VLARPDTAPCKVDRVLSPQSKVVAKELRNQRRPCGSKLFSLGGLKRYLVTTARPFVPPAEEDALPSVYGLSDNWSLLTSGCPTDHVGRTWH